MWVCKKCGKEVFLEKVYTLNKDKRVKENSVIFICLSCNTHSINDIEKIAEWED